MTTSVTSGSSALVTSGAVYTAINEIPTVPYISEVRNTGEFYDGTGYLHFNYTAPPNAESMSIIVSMSSGGASSSYSVSLYNDSTGTLLLQTTRETRSFTHSNANTVFKGGVFRVRSSGNNYPNWISVTFPDGSSYALYGTPT